MNLLNRRSYDGISSEDSLYRGFSQATYYSGLNDAIIKDHATVTSTPEITANHVDANLIHEAAIGKIAGDQLIKLMTLGLTEEQAEQEIIKGFLK